MNLPIHVTPQFLRRMGSNTTMLRRPQAEHASYDPLNRLYEIPQVATGHSDATIRKLALGMGLDPDQPDFAETLGTAVPFHEYGHQRQADWLEQALADTQGPVDFRPAWGELDRLRRLDTERSVLGSRPELEGQWLDELEQGMQKTIPFAALPAEIRLSRTGREDPSDLAHLMYRLKPTEWDADLTASALLDTDVLSDPAQPKLIPARQLARFRTTLGRNQMAAELPLSRARRRAPDPEAEYAALEARLREPLQIQLPFDQLALQRALMP